MKLCAEHPAEDHSPGERWRSGCHCTANVTLNLSESNYAELTVVLRINHPVFTESGLINDLLASPEA